MYNVKFVDGQDASYQKGLVQSIGFEEGHDVFRVELDDGNTQIIHGAVSFNDEQREVTVSCSDGTKVVFGALNHRDYAVLGHDMCDFLEEDM